MFIGAKNDLVENVDDKTRVDKLVIDRFMKRHAESDFHKSSSKEDFNIKKIFKALVIKILEKNKLDYERIG